MASPVRCHVNVILFGHEGNLLLVQSSKSKHANLFDNVTPITRCACKPDNVSCARAYKIGTTKDGIKERRQALKMNLSLVELQITVGAC